MDCSCDLGFGALFTASHNSTELVEDVLCQLPRDRRERTDCHTLAAQDANACPVVRLFKALRLRPTPG
jgi:hypothetical protein